MIIYPTIQVKGGKCVNLIRGNVTEVEEFAVAPLAAAKSYVAKGAEWLHLVDIDGILQGGEHNGEVITEIMKSVDIPCQVGGGIRTMAAAEWWFKAGADRIVLGTAAVKDRTFVREACSHWPGKVLVSIDAYEGKVVIEGWREKTMFSPLELAREFQNIGAAAIIYTDIDMDIDLPEASFAHTTQLAKELEIDVISSGTVRRLDDVAVLKHLPRISGAIIGRALFQNAVSLEDAIAVAKQPVAETPFI
ncbi:HisA/HisF-related TIM barrel protein [Pacificispira sp.]|jgi:phosphoribosylformimino-5-aminoimidazole carboxamide ribotide isomerase|uniref:1-(5-phosphoribosyl)-5-[(5- phosphoribosylamino)methylideneamino]imidazole-4- carboxamide isomerase n=1 Tax=Pacificispira sp. TaxID=2888761 RepID=UPI003BABFF53